MSTPSPSLRTTAQSVKVAVQTFPRAALVIPPVIPAVVVAGMLASGFFGARGGGIHSTGGALLTVLLWLSTLAAAVFELFFVPRAFKQFLRVQDLQTVPNLLCLAVPSIFVVLVVVWLLVASLA